MWKLGYLYTVAFGAVLCMTGIGAIFGLPLIVLAEDFRKKSLE